MLRCTVAVLALIPACTLDVPIAHVPDVVQPPPPATNGPIDILFVVDNSGSMIEEQRELALTIFNPACPISDLNHVPEGLQNPSAPEVQQLTAVCGFSQILAAFDRDFRIGIVTTDVDQCDNVLPDQEGAVFCAGPGAGTPACDHLDGGGWGFRPQRGCLQPVPSTGQRIIQRSDIDIAGKFNELIGSLGTFGSPFERGMDAADIFLDPSSTRAPGCDGDRDLLIRDDAQLLIIFVTDEDDCSHTDGALADESLGSVCGVYPDLLTQHSPSDCYTHADELTPVSTFVQRWQAQKAHAEDVHVAVIGGAVFDNGNVEAAGCIIDQSHAPSSTCFETGGLSNFTGPGEPCGPEAVAANGGETCCTADAASRYFDLGAVVGAASFTGGSICTPSFLDTIIKATGLPTPADGG